MDNHLDSKTRCGWVDLKNQLYVQYHDEEWGVPQYNDHELFGHLLLEISQAGLSWLTVLKKRVSYRQAFVGFDPEKVALYTERDIEILLQNPGLIRNRLKLNAAVVNARHFLEIQKEFGSFAAYQWQFVGGRPQVNHWQDDTELPVMTAVAERFSADLRRRGFRFIGPTTVYAHMQATGMVNDHIVGCFRYRELTP